jgi:thymidylate kinase
MEAAGTTRDRMESNQDGFYARVREAYTELARKEKRIHLLDGQRPVHEIAGEIRRIYDSLEG